MTVVLSMNRCASCGKFFRDQGDGATRCEKCVWRVPEAFQDSDSGKRGAVAFRGGGDVRTYVLW